ncbi:MAG: 2-amino-4-hydroxy-6-hydroxymethyldihydropteridine diphosphokinase [Gemmatimonadaceae bacterium]
MTSKHQPLVFVALGSNVGDREQHLRAARAAISALANTFIVGESDVEETEPLGGRQQEKYLNQMLAIRTALEPEELLDELQRIERENGRERRERWASRTLDLDMVAYGGESLDTQRLTLPHPGLAERDFWQREMAQLEAQLEERL